MFALSAQAQIPAEIIPQNLGVNIHFRHAKDAEYEQLTAAGFRFIRMDFSWDRIEKQKGQYDFSEYDGLLKQLDQHHLRPIFILDYNNKFYDNDLSPHTDEARAAMAKMAAAAVTHFKNRGVIWEMWNEPNISFWHPKPNVDDYATLAVEVGKAIKSAAPLETLIGPASSTFDWKFLESCFKNGCLEYFDAVSVHAYRHGDPETVVEDYAKLAAMIDQYKPQGKSIPIISGEWGYSSHKGGMSEAQQGKMLARELLANISAHIPLSIWYDWRDDGTNPKENEHHFGVVHHPYDASAEWPYIPKPAWDAAHTLSQQLHGYSFEKRIDLGDEKDWLLVFRDGEKTKLVAWTRGARHEIKLPAGKYAVVNHLGKTMPMAQNVISVIDAPMYLMPTE